MKTKKEVTVSSEESTSGEDAPAQSSITTPAAQSLIINDQPSSEENGSNVANNTSVSTALGERQLEARGRGK
ncbi:jg25637 [Pararge aegeria aegeria]|uniref:Jg25637 protein n=1 Tax=Pararge aegeria aegeria TaxID=348720 RepID=A0A8S4QD34_9NEOP|nr:jg25637 [Pararge aegeria aegeria]